MQVDQLPQPSPGTFGRYAVSWQLWLIVAPLGIAGSASLALDAGVSSVVNALAIGVLGESALGITYLLSFVLGRTDIRRIQRKWILATWILASVARCAIVFAITVLATGQELRGVQFELGVASLVIVGVPIQALVSYLLSSVTVYRAEGQMLAKKIRELEYIANNHQRMLTEYQLGLEKTLQLVVQPQIRSLLVQVGGTEIAESGHELEALASRIDREVMSEVRELSHAISEAPTPISVGREGEPSRMHWSEFLVAVITGPIPVGLALGFAFCLRLPVELSPGGSGGWLRTLLTLGALGLMIQLTNHVRRRIKHSWPTWSSLCIGLGIYLVIFMTSVLVIKDSTAFWPTGEMTEWLGGRLPREYAGAIWLVVGTLTASALYASEQNRRHDAKRLTSVKDLLVTELSSLQANASRVREQFAQVLHGSVQSRLAISAMLLHDLSAVKSRDPARFVNDVNRIREILESIESALFVRSGDRVHDDPLSLAAQFQKAWRGLVEIEITLRQPAQEILENSPLATELVFELLGEAILNASRHGHARNMFIDVDAGVNSELLIKATNDGDKPPRLPVQGLGMRRVRMAGGTWKLEVLSGEYMCAEILVPPSLWAHV